MDLPVYCINLNAETERWQKMPSIHQLWSAAAHPMVGIDGGGRGDRAVQSASARCRARRRPIALPIVAAPAQPGREAGPDPGGRCGLPARLAEDPEGADARQSGLARPVPECLRTSVTARAMGDGAGAVPGRGVRPQSRRNGMVGDHVRQWPLRCRLHDPLPAAPRHELHLLSVAGHPGGRQLDHPVRTASPGRRPQGASTFEERRITTSPIMYFNFFFIAIKLNYFFLKSWFEALSDFWRDIEARLSPTFFCETPIASVLERPSDDLALLHALNAHRETQLFSNKYEMYALWVQGDDLFSRVPDAPSLTMEYPKRIRTAVTNAGHLAVSTNEKFFVVSVVDGRTINEFTPLPLLTAPRVAVDIKGRVWVWTLSSRIVKCYTQEGKLLYSKRLPFYLSSVAFISDGRILFGGHNIISDLHNLLPVIAFYSLIEDRLEIVVMSETFETVRVVKVCPVTDEIYVLKKKHISVLSFDGGVLLRVRDICDNQINQPITMELTGNKHVFVSEWRCISVWTGQGVPVCRWQPFSGVPYQINVLPFGKVAVCLSKIIKNEIQIFSL